MKATVNKVSRRNRVFDNTEAQNYVQERKSISVSLIALEGIWPCDQSNRSFHSLRSFHSKPHFQAHVVPRSHLTIFINIWGPLCLHTETHISGVPSLDFGIEYSHHHHSNLPSPLQDVLIELAILLLIFGIVESVAAKFLFDPVKP